MTGRQLRELLKKYNLSQNDASIALGLSPRTIFNMIHFDDEDIPERYSKYDIEGMISEYLRLKCEKHKNNVREINIIRSNHNTIKNMQNDAGIANKDEYIQMLLKQIDRLEGVIKIMEKLLDDKYTK